jgi:hypothetical protein
MFEEVSIVLEKLKNLDLSQYSYDDAKYLISKLGKFACVEVILHKGKTIMRARPNLDGKNLTLKVN